MEPKIPPMLLPRHVTDPDTFRSATPRETERLGFYHHYHVPTEVPSDTLVAIVHDNGGAGHTRLFRDPTPHTQSKENFPAWMVRMWKEPPAGDVGSCCLAFWTPAVLSGKTDWRLKQASRGKNAQDAAWRVKDGCNGACWSYAVLEYCFCLGFIPIAFQRTRVRAVYGIKGNAVQDWALAIFCQPCTILQNDREVRAREGKHDLLSNNKKYKEHQKAQAETINTQPGPIQPMSYRSQKSKLESVSMVRQKPPAEPTKSNKEAKSFSSGIVDGAKDRFPTKVICQSKTPLAGDRSLIHSGDQPVAKSNPARTAHHGSLCRTNSPDQENVSSREHALFECAGDGTSSPRWMTKTKKKIASEVSYVHDFTDCAVDKSILDYYERQGKALESKDAHRGKEQRTPGSPSVNPRSSSKRL